MDFTYVDTIFIKPQHGFGKNRPFPNADKKEFTLLEFNGDYYVFDSDDNHGPLKIGEVVEVQGGYEGEWTFTDNWFTVDSESLVESSGMPLTYDLVKAGAQLAKDAGLV